MKTHAIALELAEIDFFLLRQQKEWLLEQDCDRASGLVGLVDYIQDLAVEAGKSEEEVFGLEVE